jgi:Flp pilus assembly pilin Flp
MQGARLKFRNWLRSIVSGENGQDIVEYVLVVSLIAFGVTAGVHSVANDVVAIMNSLVARLTV